MKTAVELKEEQFHDKWAQSVEIEHIPVLPAFESESAPENRAILKWMGDLTGRKVLELGCGLGEASTYFALKGADVTATDLSIEMLKVASQLARHHGVHIKTVQTSATHLSDLPDNSFDFIYAANLLHHVDIEVCAQEVYRKLKPGGRAYFWDPLHYNPAIQVYRRMANQVRTDDEHPLRIRDLKAICGIFGDVQLKFFWFTALAVFFKYYLIDRIHPNQSRYWKKVIEDANQIQGWLGYLHKLDRLLFAVVPGLRYWAWNVAIEARKGPPDQSGS